MMECRIGCGACCIAISISSPLPGMPKGKPAGVRCVQLDDQNRCRVWGTSEYPSVCHNFRPERAACGENFNEAMGLLAELEHRTAPSYS